jgi:hypothetical protein
MSTTVEYQSDNGDLRAYPVVIAERVERDGSFRVDCPFRRLDSYSFGRRHFHHHRHPAGAKSLATAITFRESGCLLGPYQVLGPEIAERLFGDDALQTRIGDLPAALALEGGRP